MRFLFACGGTAGHVNPAVGVAGRIRELLPDSEILFIGALGKMEMELVPREGYEIRGVPVSNLSRSLSAEGIKHNIKFVTDLIKSGPACRKIIEEFKPDVVVGTGGYVCYPVLHEAAKLGIPTLVHESNAEPGLTTRQLEKSVGENDKDNSNLDLFSLEMFEDLAWLMARHADPANVPDSPEEFLDQFNTFSIYQILPQLIELWGLNVQTEVESRKNLAKVSGK